MRRALWVLVLFALLLSGCGTHRIAVSELSGPGEVERLVGGSTGTVNLATGPAIPARDIHVTADAVSWRHRFTGVADSVPLASVCSIGIHKTARGVLKGLMYGGGVGLVFGAASYFGGDSEGDWAIVILPAAGATIGVIGGMIIEEDVYEFSGCSGAATDTDRWNR